MMEIFQFCHILSLSLCPCLFYRPPSLFLSLFLAHHFHSSESQSFDNWIFRICLEWNFNIETDKTYTKTHIFYIGCLELNWIEFILMLDCFWVFRKIIALFSIFSWLRKNEWKTLIWLKLFLSVWILIIKEGTKNKKNWKRILLYESWHFENTRLELPKRWIGANDIPMSTWIQCNSLHQYKHEHKLNHNSNEINKKPNSIGFCNDE